MLHGVSQRCVTASVSCRQRSPAGAEGRAGWPGPGGAGGRWVCHSGSARGQPRGVGRSCVTTPATTTMPRCMPETARRAVPRWPLSRTQRTGRRPLSPPVTLVRGLGLPGLGVQSVQGIQALREPAMRVCGGRAGVCGVCGIWCVQVCAYVCMCVVCGVVCAGVYACVCGECVVSTVCVGGVWCVQRCTHMHA